MKSFYCLIISLSIHLCGYAILPTQFHFRHYNIENGVSSNNISTLFQDQKGYIWIGTENGLNRFDGNQFTLYQKSNPLYSNLPGRSGALLPLSPLRTVHESFQSYGSSSVKFLFNRNQLIVTSY